MRVRLPAACVVLATAAVAAPVPAQPAGTASPGTVPGCTYDSCALRRERVFFSERLLAGVQGTVVGRPRVFGTLPIDSIVHAVPEAQPYARTYRREAFTGGALTTLGTVVGLVAFVDALRTRGTCTTSPTATTCKVGNYDRQLALAGVGIALGAVGGWRLQISDRALNRAVWWYNRALVR